MNIISGSLALLILKEEEIASISKIEGLVSTKISLNDMYEFRDKCTILNDIKENYEVKLLCVK